MVTTFIELGGKNRPIRFSYEGLYAYEKFTGRKALNDLLPYFESVAQIKEQNDKIEEEGGEPLPYPEPSMDVMINVVYAGLYAGSRIEKQPIDFDDFVVAGWVGENPQCLEVVLQLFVQSLNKAEKKQTPRPMKAKAQN